MDPVPGSIMADQAADRTPEAAIDAREPGPSASRIDRAMALAALALALIGQFYFKNLRSILDGFVFFGAAIVLFIILASSRERGARTGGSATDVWARIAARVRSEPIRVALIVFSFVLTFTVFRLLKAQPPPRSYWDIFYVWVAAAACFVAAFVHRPRIDLAAWWRAYRWELLAVIALTAAAAVLRFVELGRVPNIVSGDEGRIGLLSLSAIDGEINNMLATTFGHSTLYLLIIGALMRLSDIGPHGLRLTSAIAGALTVPAVYLLARRMFNVRTALVAAALLTVSHLHLHFSRIVVAGGIQDALFATMAFYFLLTGLEKRSALRLVLSALVIGSHVYIYMGARLVILFVPVYVLALLIVEPKTVKENALNLAAFAVMLAIMVVPMGVWALAHPADFMARANQVGVFQSGWLASEAIKLNQSQQHILLNLLLQAFLTVNYYPATGFYNSPLPMLDFLSGAIFMLGIGYSLYHVFDRRHLLLQGWFWSGVVVGGALVVLPAISAYRILIIFPAVCIFVGLGLDRLIEFALPSRAASRRLLQAGLVAAFIVVVSTSNVRAYFADYGPSCRYEDWGTRFASYMGEALGRSGPSYRAFLFGYPRIWYGIHPSVDYLSGRIPITDIKEPLRAPANLLKPGEGGIFFFTPDREKELAFVQQAHPGGQVRQVYDCKQLMLTIYQLDGERLQP
jgi:4-amino-4-deoxy-L-arabinose transferase-like glycosyltransferase